MIIYKLTKYIKILNRVTNGDQFDIWNLFNVDFMSNE